MLVLLISAEPWGDIWFSKQHYANELAKLGHYVYFLNPPQKWKVSHLWSRRIRTKEIKPGLTIVEYDNPLPLRLFPKTASRINDTLNGWKLKSLLTEEGAWAWQFDFLRLHQLPKLISKRIYHVADPYMGTWGDAEVGSRADAIVCTSPKYVPHYQKRYPDKPVFHIPHGLAEDEFVIDEKEKKKIEKQHGADFVILIGTINDSVNFDLLQEASNHTKLLVLGKVLLRKDNLEQWEALLQAQSNLAFIGPVHAQSLKYFISLAKVCLLVYQFDLKKTIGSGSPLKILNYLCQYRPVISTIDPEIPQLEGKAIYQAKDIQQYRSLLLQGLAGDLDVDREAVWTYLRSHIYPTLIQKILDKADA